MKIGKKKIKIEKKIKKLEKKIKKKDFHQKLKFGKKIEIEKN